VDGLANNIKIMYPNSIDPHSEFHSIEQEIEMCIDLRNEIELKYGNTTPINESVLF